MIREKFRPNLIIAIGGGGYVPARILRYACVNLLQGKTMAHELSHNDRSFLKKSGSPNIPIQAIGLSLYEQLPSDLGNAVEQPGTKVTRTQWLDLSSLQMKSLIGKNILIVDEVDDTRTTLEYAVRELQKDVEIAAKDSDPDAKTNFYIFVLHNKDKPKRGRLPDDFMDEGRYLAAMSTEDVWICYPWEAKNISKHDRKALQSPLVKPEDDIEEDDNDESDVDMEVNDKDNVKTQEKSGAAIPGDLDGEPR